MSVHPGNRLEKRFQEKVSALLSYQIQFSQARTFPSASNHAEDAPFPAVVFAGTTAVCHCNAHIRKPQHLYCLQRPEQCLDDVLTGYAFAGWGPPDHSSESFWPSTHVVYDSGKRIYVQLTKMS